MKKIKLYNTFHNTEICVLSKSEHCEYMTDLNYLAYSGNKNAKRQLHKIKSALCHNQDCRCEGMVKEVQS